MLAKLSKGAGFRSLITYIFTREDGTQCVPRGEIIGGNMAASDARGLAAEFGQVRALKPGIKKPVFHGSLSLPAGKTLADTDWQTASKVFLQRMGIDPDQHQYVVVRHSDTNHDHVHLVANRISFTGKVAREERGDFKKSHEAAAAAAEAVGLQPVPKSPTPGLQLNRADTQQIRSGQVPEKLTLASVIDAAAVGAKDFEDFKKRAAAGGVEVETVSNSGGAYGIKFRLAGEPAGHWLKGSQIGRGYSFKAIENRLKFNTDRPTLADRLKTEKTNQGIEYRWASGALAVIDQGDALLWRTGSAGEARLLADLAAKKGWTSIELANRGRAERNDAAIIEYMAKGIAVSNLKLSEEGYAKYIARRDGPRVGNETDRGTTAVGAQINTGNARPPEGAGEGAGNGRVGPAGGRDGSAPAGNGRPADGDRERDDFSPATAGRTQRPAEKDDSRDQQDRRRASPAAVAQAAESLNVAVILSRLFYRLGRWIKSQPDAAKRRELEQLEKRMQERLAAEPSVSKKALALEFLAALHQVQRPPAGLADAQSQLGQSASNAGLKAAIADCQKAQVQKTSPTPVPAPMPPGPSMSM